MKSKSFELKRFYRAQSNMGSDRFDVIFHKPLTVREFIEEVASDKREWGYIRVDIGEEDSWKNPGCEYRWGAIISYLPEEYFDRKIISGESSGGWSRMDYMLKLEGESQ